MPTYYETSGLDADALSRADILRMVATEQLEISAGDWVRYADDQLGVVLETTSSDFTWPQGEDDEMDVEVGDETWAIVGRASGGAKPFPVSELESTSEPDLPDDVAPEDAAEAELSEVYYAADDPFSVEELRRAEELVANVPGVKDPHVGWKRMPPSWRESEKPARVILLYTWARLGGQFRTCVAEMSDNISRPKRFCASFKDEVWGTTRWRNRF